MSSCDLETSVPDWVIDHPETLAVFRVLGIDYSCGGKSLAYACQERGLDPVPVLQQLQQAIRDTLAVDDDSPILSSIQIGQPVTQGTADAADPMDRLWTTGFYKQPVAGWVEVGLTNLAGDGQADLVHHGGPDKAILAYSADHYPEWRAELARPDLPWGAFGENFSITGETEQDVCLGDTWQIGDGVTVQVSQPRQPCWKLARRWRIKTLAADVQRTGRTGWYFRVLVTGRVHAGQRLKLVERPYPDWTIARCNQVMHVDKKDLAAAAELAAKPLLSASWQSTLQKRSEQRKEPDPAARLIGQNTPEPPG